MSFHDFNISWEKNHLDRTYRYVFECKHCHEVIHYAATFGMVEDRADYLGDENLAHQHIVQNVLRSDMVMVHDNGICQPPITTRHRRSLGIELMDYTTRRLAQQVDEDIVNGMSNEVKDKPVVMPEFRLIRED